jgi:hypothetical protein
LDSGELGLSLLLGERNCWEIKIHREILGVVYSSSLNKKHLRDMLGLGMLSPQRGHLKRVHQRVRLFRLNNHQVLQLISDKVEV